MSFDVERTVFDDCFVKWQNGAMIQHAFPMLNADEREFLMTGMTISDWKETTKSSIYS